MENYLVNPVNPMVTLRHKPWVQHSWRKDVDGRFGKLPAGKKKKTKNPLRRKAKRRFKALTVRRINPMPLMLLNKKRRTAKRRVSRAVRRPSHALMTLNPRRKSIRRVRRFHHNPLMPKMGEVGKLVMTGALIVAGATGGGYLMGKLSAKFPVLQQPMVKIGAYAGLGILTFVLLKKVRKVTPAMAASLATGIMLPAIMDVKDLLVAKLGGAAPVAVAYGGQELSAFVPRQSMGAYVPQSGMAESDYGAAY